MNRRGFLRLLGLGTAVVVAVPLALELDPDRLLWVPGAKRIFLPSLVEPSVNSFGHLLTNEMITREALRILKNNFTFAAQVNREYDRDFEGARIGQTVNIRLPQRYAPRPGGTLWAPS